MANVKLISEIELPRLVFSLLVGYVASAYLLIWHRLHSRQFSVAEVQKRAIGNGSPNRPGGVLLETALF